MVAIRRKLVLACENWFDPVDLSQHPPSPLASSLPPGDLVTGIETIRAMSLVKAKKRIRKITSVML